MAGVHVPLTITSKFPASVVAGFVMVSVAVVTLVYGAVLVRFVPFILHWYVIPVPVAVTLIVAVPLPAQISSGATGSTAIEGVLFILNAPAFCALYEVD